LGIEATANRSIVLTAGNQSFLLDANKSYKIRGGYHNISASFLNDTILDSQLDSNLRETTDQLRSHMLASGLLSSEMSPILDKLQRAFITTQNSPIDRDRNYYSICLHQFLRSLEPVQLE
jgi:hypothetical protein